MSQVQWHLHVVPGAEDGDAGIRDQPEQQDESKTRTQPGVMAHSPWAGAARASGLEGQPGL